MTTEEEIEAADAESMKHPRDCNCVFCFSRHWDEENPNKCHVCVGARGHEKHDPPYDG